MKITSYNINLMKLFDKNTCQFGIMEINTLEGSFFMKDIIIAIVSTILSAIPLILVLRYIYKSLYKKYITSPGNKDDPKSLMRSILLSLIIYVIGFMSLAYGGYIANDSGEVGPTASIFLSLAGLIVTIGLALLIYTIQALESKSTIDIIENRIEKKLKDISKNDIKELILHAANTQMDKKLDSKRIEDEIVRMVSAALIKEKTDK
ncbi:hypothetical protein ACFWGC_28500 [Cytobacillus pseudoceanisediminis]